MSMASNFYQQHYKKEDATAKPSKLWRKGISDLELSTQLNYQSDKNYQSCMKMDNKDT